MNIKDNKILKNIFLAIGIIILSVFAECFIFNFQSIFDSYDMLSFNLNTKDGSIQINEEELLVELSEDEIEAIKLQRENDKILAQLNGTEYVPAKDESLIEKDNSFFRKVYKSQISLKLDKAYYIKKLELKYPTANKLGYSISVFRDGKELKKGEVYDTLDPQTGISITNVGKKGDGVLLTISSNQKFDGINAQVTISNDFSFNMFRALFIMASFMLLAFLLLNRSWFEKRIELVFAVSALIFGAFLIIFNGTNQLSWDEHIHYESAYRASFGKTIQFTESAYKMVGLTTPTAGSMQERQIIADYLQEWNDYTKADLKNQQRLTEYNKRSYIPQALGLALARKLNAPFNIAYMMGKFGNLIFYILMMMIAIRIAKLGKMCIALIGLMPTPLFLASSYAYDAFITSLIFIGFILWLNEILDKESRLKWYNALFMILCFVIGCWSKAIYMAMMLLLVFLPKNKFDNRLKEICFKLGAIIIVVMMLYTIVSPPAQTASNVYSIETDISYFGDKRVSNTSFLGQIEFILKNPIEYTGILLRQIFKTSFDYILGTSSWLLYAYAGRFPSGFAIASALLLIVTALVKTKEERNYILENKWKILLGIMFFGVTCLLWTGMYITFTGVGENYINGFQGRYYIPLILPLMLIFKNQKISQAVSDKISDTMFKKLIFGIIFFINIYGTYVFFLKPFCF